ncbi:MAG: AI-2E family transporter, partial [Ramlibacter sp.]|nr:AI-2E family transporter [Ramlibacter sp.]
MADAINPATLTPSATSAPPQGPLLHDPEDPSHVLLHAPQNVRSTMLVVLTVLAVLATLKWAAAFFIPVMVGLMFSYALSPVVDWLHKLRIPRAVSAAVLIIGILGGTGASMYAFSDDANELVQSLPDAARKLRDSMRSRSDRTDTIGTVQKAAAQLEQAAAEAGGAPAAPRGATRVVVEKPRFDIRDHLWNGTLGLASLIGQVVVVTFLTYFL